MSKSPTSVAKLTEAFENSLIRTKNILMDTSTTQDLEAKGEISNTKACLHLKFMYFVLKGYFDFAIKG